MKYLSFIPGNDGHSAIAAGEEVARDSDFARRLLCNGLAEPLDDHAKAVAADPKMRARHASPALAALAREVADARRAAEAAAVASEEAARVEVVAAEGEG